MWHFLDGYVIIQTEGLCAARLLRRISESGVRVTNVKRTGEASVQFSIPARRFASLHALRKGLPVRIRIVKKGGVPFLLLKLRKRPVLWIGTLLLFSGMLILSKRIWVIRIGETNSVDPKEIRLALSERGIRPGAYLSGPILITAANDLSAQVHNAAWIGLDREGVMLKVNVQEALPESAKCSNAVPSDVVAEKDGVITSILVMRGQARVKVGDRVKKGDVLISGHVVYKESGYDTAADGVVKAAVNYGVETELLQSVTESFETEAEETIRVWKIAGFELLRSRPSFEHYRVTGTETVSASSLLPIVIERASAREIGFRERTLSDEEAEQYSLIRAKEQAYALIPRDAAVINTYGTIRTRKGKRFACVIVTAEETIGKTEEAPHDG